MNYREAQYKRVENIIREKCEIVDYETDEVTLLGASLD